MINNSSYFLNNYQLERFEIGFCFITGLTCAPYAKRHWELSNKNPKYSLWHKVIAGLEYMPVIGGIVALTERIIVFASSFFSNIPSNLSQPNVHLKDRDSLTIQTIGNATALEFISCINPTLFSGLTPLTEEEAQEFLNRGGSLNIITNEKINEKKITLSKEEQIITGCTSGVNRSQVAAATLIKMNIKIKGILAGGDSAMNPEADFPSFASLSDTNEELLQSAMNFEKAFGMCKLDRIGEEKLELSIEGENIRNAKKFYQDYIDLLAQTHFITFAVSGPSVIRRLLKREGSLTGFTITHFPWGDEIAHPPENSKLERFSIESYQSFAAKISNCFNIT
jgi:hypothetical protein